jgi:hypothetical protein
MFKPITTEADLPDVGKAKQFEGQTFDAKAPREEKPYHLAKHVAAFANAEGGTILIGAIEDLPTGVLTKYEPMPSDRARDVRDAYDRAVKDRCRPAPLMMAVIIPKGTDTFLVAVNVYPSPLLPVAVRVVGDGKEEGYGGDAYTFPIRLGTQVEYLKPEQLGMFMEPKIRRVALLLDGIPEAARKRVVLFDCHGAGRPEVRPLKEVDFLGARVVFGSHEVGTLVVPLDLVQSVCRLEDGSWCVAYDGASHVPWDARHAVALPAAH